jgi:hypothetical protein
MRRGRDAPPRPRCDPDLCYECAHAIGDIFGDDTRCDNVNWCSNWDPDCSKSGNEDDHWFYGFESLDDCEDYHDVPFRKGLCVSLLVVASLFSGTSRLASGYLVHAAPESNGAIGVAASVQPAAVPVVSAVELAGTDGPAVVAGANAVMVPSQPAHLEGHAPPDDPGAAKLL